MILWSNGFGSTTHTMRRDSFDFRTKRYFWRTGHRWSGEGSPVTNSTRRLALTGRGILIICFAFIVTLAGLILTR